jgi:3-dehydrocarnitine:acetyl-CoA trimethylamine transferase
LPARPESILQLRSLLPDGANWAAFGISRGQFPIAACSVLMGGHVRVGLEDSIYIERGVLAEGNAPLVRRAVELIRQLGERPATTDEARQILELS